MVVRWGRHGKDGARHCHSIPQAFAGGSEQWRQDATLSGHADGWRSVVTEGL
jgi:predicted DNA-binding WGR domain protein